MPLGHAFLPFPRAFLLDPDMLLHIGSEASDFEGYVSARMSAASPKLIDLGMSGVQGMHGQGIGYIGGRVGHSLTHWSAWDNSLDLQAKWFCVHAPAGGPLLSMLASGKCWVASSASPARICSCCASLERG
jgi:hypothetical protein